MQLLEITGANPKRLNIQFFHLWSLGICILEFGTWIYYIEEYG